MNQFSNLMLITLLLATTLSIKASGIEVTLPSYGVNNQNLAIIVKRGDLLSIKTAEYYQQKRNIPAKNIYTVDLPDQASMSAGKFKKLYQQLQKDLPKHIQGLVLTWQTPYQVGCMSITSAFSFGFDPKYCQQHGKGCQQTANSPYFNATSIMPWQNFKIRPSMLLTGQKFSDIKALIDRGVESDYSQPVGSAYLVRTSDRNRSSRWGIFKNLAENWQAHDKLTINYLDHSKKEVPNHIENKQDIMFYQTGLERVPFIEKNTYLPGSIADHLTSAGGKGLSVKGQMKAFRWLEAGATGSYGAVIEPCNFTTKFPNPVVLIPHYLQGETLIEAYWKSVKQPGEGLFIGEPLARPYGIHKVYATERTVLIKTQLLKPNRPYKVLALNQKTNKYQPIKFKIRLHKDKKTLILKFNNVKSKRFKIVDLGLPKS